MSSRDFVLARELFALFVPSRLMCLPTFAKKRALGQRAFGQGDDCALGSMRCCGAGESAEAALLARARAGETEAISILLNRHRARLTNLCFQILRDREGAEDAAQEILLRALQKLPSFRGESEFAAWLYRLTLNFCLEKRRLERRRAELLEQHLREANGDGGNRPCAGGAQAQTQAETRQLLEIALDELSEPLRVALLLREWQGFSYQEIAEITQLLVGTVRSRLHQARAQFRASWERLNATSAPETEAVKPR